MIIMMVIIMIMMIIISLSHLDNFFWNKLINFLGSEIVKHFWY